MEAYSLIVSEQCGCFDSVPTNLPVQNARLCFEVLFVLELFKQKTPFFITIMSCFSFFFSVHNVQRCCFLFNLSAVEKC